MNRVVEKLQQAQVRKDLPEFRPGDTVRVHVRLKEVEGEKERIQPFEGVVISKRGRLAGASFTVRRVSFGIGIERIFPVNSPTISSVEVQPVRFQLSVAHLTQIGLRLRVNLCALAASPPRRSAVCGPNRHGAV